MGNVETRGVFSYRGAAAVRKRGSTFHENLIVLPRQARDKQRETALKNKTPLLFEQAAAAAAAAAATDRYETRLSFERLIYKNDYFTKTASGQR